MLATRNRESKESDMPEWVHTISGWVIVHKDHITLLAALTSAFAAIVVMFLTRTLATDNRLLRKAGTEPGVVAYLRPDQQHIHILNLVVANVGRGPARNVELEFVGDLELLRKCGARLLTKPKLMILPWLPQEERFVEIFGNALDFFEGTVPPEFAINVHFQNSAGKKQTTISRISIGDFEGLSRLRGADYEAAEALKQIAKSIDGWGGFNRLKVETVTAAEVAREQKAQRDAIMEQKKNRDSEATGK
jgi:hypothetical protein